jgi:acetyl-CoA carboxylase biotin carboxyl carrier protein
MNADTQAPQPAADSLESLCKQARVLATGLPGALTRLTVMAGQNRVEMEWRADSLAGPAAAGSPAAGDGNGTAALSTGTEVTPETGHAVVAPLVGTFYRSPEPDAAPFVTEGDLIEAGQQVAIVEAMKIMNSIQADQAGRVAKILAADGDMVEYGQQLMILEPADAES